MFLTCESLFLRHQTPPLFPFFCVHTAPQHDMPIYSFCMAGNETCWPKTSKVGGLPCKIKVSLIPVAPQGPAQLFSEGRIRRSDDGKGDHVALAEHCRGVMQTQVTALYGEDQVGHSWTT